MKKVLFTLAFATASMFANSLADIRNSGVLRIGVYQDAAPFSHMHDGRHVGFESELGAKIGEDIFGDKKGLVKFVYITDMQRINMLEKNKVDMIIADFTPTEKRAKRVAFSDPYFVVQTGVVMDKDSSVTELDQIKNHKILVEQYSPTERFFQKLGFKNLVKCTEMKDCYRKFKDGKAEAFAGDNIVVKTYPVVDRKTKVALDNLGKKTYNAIAVAKGNTELLKFVNDELAKLKENGFLDKTFDETLGAYFRGHIDREHFLVH